MKQLRLLVILLLLCSVNVLRAQDVIVKNDGSTIVCWVVEITSTEIVYKKQSDLNASNYVMNRADASAINYQNGKKVILSEATNLYTPNNKNARTQQYDDRTLLGMDYESQKAYKNVKRLKIWGLISGIVGIGAGALLLNVGNNADYKEGQGKYGIAGGVVAAGGIATAVYCFAKARKKRKQQEMYLQSSTLYQYNIEFNNGSHLSASIDMLRDGSIGNNTLGLGVRYNF